MTEYWCRKHGKHGEWRESKHGPWCGKHKPGVPSALCWEKPIAPDVVAAIKAEGAAQERTRCENVTAEAILMFRGEAGLPEMEQAAAYIQRRITSTNNPRAMSLYQARIRADERRKTLLSLANQWYLVKGPDWLRSLAKEGA